MSSSAAPLGATLPASSGRSIASWLRPFLMGLGFVALGAAGIYFWLLQGAGFSTDDAYVRAPKLAIAADVSGVVATVAVHEGQYVHMGDALVVLDPLPFTIAVDQARAALDTARLEMLAAKRDYARAQREITAASARVQSDSADNDRYTALVKTGGVTHAEYDTARFKLSADQSAADAQKAGAEMLLARLGGDENAPVDAMPSVRNAAAHLAEAQRQLAHSTLRAPFNGVVTNVDSLQPGQYLAASTAAVALVGVDDVWVEAFPKETDLTYAHVGDPAELRVDTYPGHVFHGVIQSISPASANSFSVLPAQNSSGNWVKVVQRIPVRISILRAPNDPPLRDGMSVDVFAASHHQRALADLLP